MADLQYSSMSDLSTADQNAILQAIYGSTGGTSTSGSTFATDSLGYTTMVGSGTPSSYEAYQTSQRNNTIMYAFIGAIGLVILYYAIK